MIYEYAIAAQILSFILGFLLHTFFSKVRQNRFFDSLSEETLIKIKDDIRRKDMEQYD